MTRSELERQVRYLMDAEGRQTDVVVPIAVWKQLVTVYQAGQSEGEQPLDLEDDPLVGLFVGPKDLAAKSEEIVAGDESLSLVQNVRIAQIDYEAGNVKRGLVLDLMNEIDE